MSQLTDYHDDWDYPVVHSTSTEDEDQWGDILNGLVEHDLDEEVIKKDTLVNRPAAGNQNRWFLATDELELFLDDGTDWNRIVPAAARTDEAETITAGWTFDAIATLADQGVDPAAAGEMTQNLGDVKVYSGGAVRNLSNVAGSGTDRTVSTVTAAYTASDAEVVLADASGGGFTVTLPAASNGISVFVKKISGAGNTVTVASPNTETIDGQSELTISGEHVSREVTSDGTNYFII